MKFSLHSRRGQTLVEALVALSLLMTGFIGIVTLLTKSFQLNRTTTNDTQATYLASEGIEIAKNIIDHDVYYGLHFGNNDWGCSFGLGAGASADYELNYDDYPSACDQVDSVAASKAQSDPLYFNSGSGAGAGFYSYHNLPSAVPTVFTRDVRVTAVSDPSNPSNSNELDVQSIVTWTEGSISNTITLEDHFYNWQP
jgi:hypothetical protein